ncbi:MAG: hypothetical protein CBC47_01740 [Alphaproteobacteria bacterium TMED87]|nr:uracil-DNA glycosylase [Rhodospirillaceae bacterium]OUV11165.1 MAG: hypothetical protein CBC47_01740 [Alphaproteobacteria bacterium TMED87]
MINSNSEDKIPPETLLKLYVDFGIDETIGFKSKDYLAILDRIEEDRDSIDGIINNKLPKKVEASSQETSRNLQTLDELRQSLEGIKDFSLKLTSKNTVFSDGNPTSDLMVVGEAPGGEEDLSGLPFVGPSGRLLDEMLSSIGFTRKNNIYVTNVIPWRPPGNRRPTPDEVNFCLPYLLQHIKIIKPKLLLLLGGLAGSSLLGKVDGITKYRGKWSELVISDEGKDLKIPCLATFHPAYLLRSPHQRRLSWRDLLEVKEKLRSIVG